MRPHIPTTGSGIPSDPIEARLIEIRDALNRITEILQAARREAQIDAQAASSSKARAA